jgi:diguanylate cyclase (GGDEF)-like protein
MGIADVVRGSVREIDIAARYSGDKFAVLLPDASAGGGGKDNEVMRIADRIQGEIDEKIFDEDASTLTLCIGISEFPTHADDPVTILEQADWAVRQARNAGNGCVMVAGDSSSGTAAETD